MHLQVEKSMYRMAESILFFVLCEDMLLVRVVRYILSVLVRLLPNCNMAEHNALF